MNKPQLRFHQNGKFRVLMVSDFHAGADCSPKLIRGLEALVAESRPDFVMIGGDQVLRKPNAEENRAYFCRILEPILRRGLPWGAIFGNHDREDGHDVVAEMEMYGTIDGFLGEKGPEGVSGVGNYIIPILSADGSRVAYRLWAMDSHRGHEDANRAFHLPADTRISLPHTEHRIVNQSMPYPDQVAWYYDNSRRFEQEEGRKTPGVMFFHIMLPEFLYVHQNPEQTNAVGMQRESLDATPFNSGLFTFALQRGDIKGFFAGHDHLNTLQGEYCGITMALDGALGYDMSAHDDLRGGRVIDLYETGEVRTRMLYLVDLLGKDAFRDPDYFEGGSKYNIRVL